MKAEINSKITVAVKLKKSISCCEGKKKNLNRFVRCFPNRTKADDVSYLVFFVILQIFFPFSLSLSAMKHKKLPSVPQLIVLS